MCVSIINVAVGHHHLKTWSREHALKVAEHLKAGSDEQLNFFFQSFILKKERKNVVLDLRKNCVKEEFINDLQPITVPRGTL